jgi:uncharacterized protein (DUF58 family)
MISSRRFLDLGALASLDHLRFAPRRRLEGTYSGRYASRRLGGAGEFADFREYAGGEDLRRIDWKVLARTDKAFTRVYQDENNLVCTLVIDASGSMNFGSPGTKLEYVQYLATALSYLIGRQQDQVGLAIVSDRLDVHLPPGGTQVHIAAIHDAIEKLVPRPATKLAEGLSTLFQRSPTRGVLVLVSDFLVEPLDDVFAALRLFRHRGWDVLALHLVHPDEERLPTGVSYRYIGLEDEGAVDGSPEMIADDYARRFEAHAATVRTLATATGCDCLRVSTAVSYLRTLGHFLVERTG